MKELTLIVKLRFILSQMKGIFVLRNRLIVFAIFVILIQVPSALAEELTPAKEADIKKLLELTGSLEIGLQMAQFIEQLIDQQIKSVRPDIPARFLEILHEETHRLLREKTDEPGGFVHSKVQIYSKYFTHTEIKGLLQFHQSELGKKIIKVMPQLMSECAIAAQQWAQRITPIIYENVLRRCKEEGIELPKMPPGDQSGAKQNLTRGVDYAAQGKFKEAKEEFGKVSQADPSFGSAKRSLKIIEDVADQEIERQAAINYFKGAAHALKGQHEQSIPYYNKALEINPAFANAYFSLGIAYHNKDQYDQAITDYNKAIELNPNFGQAYGHRGVAYYFKGEYEKAWLDIHKTQSLGGQVHPGFLKALREASGKQE